MFSLSTPSILKRFLSLFIMGGLLFSLGFSDLSADAKKKKKVVDPQAEEKLKKGLEPLSDSLSKLLIKIQSRYLFSPEDSGELADIRYKLMALMKEHPKNKQMVQPVYQAAVLYQKRELYDEAYELYTFLSSTFPENPYGLRSTSEIRTMKRLLGENYFPPPIYQPKVKKPKSKKKNSNKKK